MEIELRKQQDILKATNELMNILPLIKDKPYICEIKPLRKRRSLNANAYFHVLCDDISKAMKLSLEEVKVKLNLDYGTIAKDEKGLIVGFKAFKEVPITQYFKYAKPFEEVEENGKTFIKYIIYKETHTLDTSEMARLIDGTVQEAQQLSIETKTPDEIAQIKALWGQEK